MKLWKTWHIKRSCTDITDQKRQRGLSLPNFADTCGKKQTCFSPAASKANLFSVVQLWFLHSVCYIFFSAFLNRLKWWVFHSELWAEQYRSSFRSQYFHSGQSEARLELRAPVRHTWPHVSGKAAGGSSHRIRLYFLFKRSETNKQPPTYSCESQNPSYFFYVSVIFFKP